MLTHKLADDQYFMYTVPGRSLQYEYLSEVSYFISFFAEESLIIVKYQFT